MLELATSDERAVVKVEFVPKRELPPEDKQRMKALGVRPGAVHLKSPRAAESLAALAALAAQLGFGLPM